MPISTATSEPGTRGANRRSPSTTASEMTPTARVAPLVSPSWVITSQIFWKKLPEPLGMPKKPGSWPAMITSARPMMNPFSTGSEMRLAMNPSLKMPASSAVTPAEIASAAVSEA